jgi:hypothetical protein
VPAQLHLADQPPQPGRHVAGVEPAGRDDQACSDIPQNPTPSLLLGYGFLLARLLW